MSCQASDWRRKGNSEIVAIFNRYNHTLNDFIDSSDPESSNRSGQIDKGLRNVLKFEASSIDFLIKNCLDEDNSNRLS